MSVTYSYSGAGTGYNVGRLSDELVAGGVTVLTVRGDTAAVDVVCADGTVQATVDALVAAHVGTTPPPHVYPVLDGSTTKWVRGDGTLVDPLASSTAAWAPVNLMTTTALAAYTRTSNDIEANAVGAQSVDGTVLVVGLTVVLNHGASGSDNGIWQVTQTGTGGAKLKMSRRSDADSSSDFVSGRTVLILIGTVNTQKTVSLTSTTPLTLNTDAIAFGGVNADTLDGIHASGFLQTTGQNVQTGDLTINASAKGLVLKDSAGTPHYWRISVSTLGVLTTADLGTSAP